MDTKETIPHVAQRAANAHHTNLITSGTATDAEIRAAHLACLRADLAMCEAYGDTASAAHVRGEIKWSIMDAARVGVVLA